MILARAWRRQLCGGVSAALIVPGTILAALAVLALAGGFARLGALGQAFSGPPESVFAPAGAAGAHASRSVSNAALVALVASAPRPVAAPSGAGAVRVGPSSGTTRPGTTRGNSGGAHPSVRPSHPVASPPHPTLIDEVVGAGSTVTGQLPGPAGVAATQALQSAGSTVDGVLPIPAPGLSQPPAAPTGAAALP